MRTAVVCAVAGTLVILSACQGYKPGSFSQHGVPFQGQQVALDCVDAAVAARTDEVATGAVIGFTLANRCDRAVAIDFGSVRARHIANASESELIAPSDPRGELRVVYLEARTVATEYLEFAVGGERQTLCVDVTGLVANRQATNRQPVCLDVRTAEVL